MEMWRPPTTIFEASPIEENQWAAPNDAVKKKAFAVELAKGLKPFDAAMIVYPDDTGTALWASQNWANDPEVLQEQKLVVEILKPLDKDALAAKILKFSEEKDASGKFYLAEDKTRLAALKLYAEVQGYIGKIDIDASTKNFNTNNEMKIVLVSPPKQETVIEHEEETETDTNVIPLQVKLVG